MLKVAQKYEMMRTEPGTAYVPFYNTQIIDMGFSTYYGNFNVNHLNGSVATVTPTKKVDTRISNISNINTNYGSVFSGDVGLNFLLGLGDVYSIYMTFYQYTNENRHKLNIQDWGSFILQFPRLNNFKLFFYAYNTAANYAVIKGDLAIMPDSIESIWLSEMNINPSSNLEFNLSNISLNSRLKYLRYDGQVWSNRVKFHGDLAKLPQSVVYCNIAQTNGGSFTYTAGKTWASAFDTLSIPLVLTTAELDALMQDMDGSILTKTGAGVISIGGYRSSASDAFVASLQAKGFTINISTNKINANNFTDSALLRLDFQNNFDVYSNSGINLSDGNNYANQPTFALSGRKAGEYCAVFNGSQSIKTTTNLPINSDKVTIKFWIKTSNPSAAGIISEVGNDSINAFAIYMNNTNGGCLAGNDRGSAGYNIFNHNTMPFNSWVHIVVTLDRAKNGLETWQVYQNGILKIILRTQTPDNNGNFVNNILFIGQRGGSSLGFNGSLMHLEILNYPITASEALADYNSFL